MTVELTLYRGGMNYCRIENLRPDMVAVTIIKNMDYPELPKLLHMGRGAEDVIFKVPVDDPGWKRFRSISRKEMEKYLRYFDTVDLVNMKGKSKTVKENGNLTY